MFLPLDGGVSQTVTHAPRNGEGGKVSLDTLLLKCASPTPLWYTRRTFILNFGSDVLKAPTFFFLGCGHVGAVTADFVPRRIEGCWSSPRLVCVLKPALSHRPRP